MVEILVGVQHLLRCVRIVPAASQCAPIAIVASAISTIQWIAGHRHIVQVHTEFLRVFAVVQMDLLLLCALSTVLRGAHGTKAQGVVAQLLLQFDEVEETAGVGLIHPSVLTVVGKCGCYAPSAFEFAGVVSDVGAHQSIVAHRELYLGEWFGGDALCQDVHAATHCRYGQLARSQTALHLHALRNSVQPEPVAPIDPTVLHVVHRNTIYHHRDVSLTEPTDSDPRIARATALIGRIHARSGVEQHRQILPCKFLLDLYRVHVGERYWGLATYGHVGHHAHLVERNGGQREVHFQRVALQRYGLGLLFIADIGNGKRVAAIGHFDGVLAIKIGDHALPLGNQYTGCNERFARCGILHCAIQPCLLGEGPHGGQAHRQRQQEMSHEKTVDARLLAQHHLAGNDGTVCQFNAYHIHASGKMLKVETMCGNSCLTQIGTFSLLAYHVVNSDVGDILIRRHQQLLVSCRVWIHVDPRFLLFVHTHIGAIAIVPSKVGEGVLWQAVPLHFRQEFIQTVVIAFQHGGLTDEGLVNSPPCSVGICPSSSWIFTYTAYDVQKGAGTFDQWNRIITIEIEW